MADEIIVSTWEEFESSYLNLRDSEEKAGRDTASWLFRGQGDSSWDLRTTLDRSTHAPMRVLDYYRLMVRAQPQIEAFTQNAWTLPDYKILINSFDDFSTFTPYVSPHTELYPFMVYLRHHGFPSPLLDWTRSYRVAAYFAFRNAVNVEAVAIYVFSERPTRIKSNSSNEPYIHRLGSYVKTHQRHFMQKSEYTVCMLANKTDTLYVPHEDIFKKNSDEQDVVWKFILPTSERLKVLRLFEEFNLNSYSLFGSEESLIETIAMRELHLRMESEG